MFNNNIAVLYKSFAEWASIAFMLISLIIGRKSSSVEKRKALWVVFAALMLFLATFSITEYVAAQTAIYEINLYGLFVLPAFLIVMVFAITNLEIFKIRYLGAQLLIYILILLIASQFLFLQSSTDALLNGLTLALAFVIGLILLQNEKQELNSIVEIEQLADELAATNTRLQELDQLKTQFLSFASHQLKSPLTAIKWQAQLLADGTTGKLPKQAVRSALDIEESADRLVDLVSEFLNLRKLQEGRMEYSFEPTDVAELVSKVVRELKHIADHKGLTMSFENHAARTLCSVDRQKFEQIIQNLIDNALKYTDKGGVSVRIEDTADRMIRISVVDTGHGINPTVIASLFEQFVRGRKDATKVEGTGLGLYIAKQIITAHGGDIGAASPGIGKGSTFFVDLKVITP